MPEVTQSYIEELVKHSKELQQDLVGGKVLADSNNNFTITITLYSKINWFIGYTQALEHLLPKKEKKQ